MSRTRAKREATRTMRHGSHELVSEGVTGGLNMRCTCGERIAYTPQPVMIKGRNIADRGGTFPTGRVGWALARQAHQRHLASLGIRKAA